MFRIQTEERLGSLIAGAGAIWAAHEGTKGLASIWQFTLLPPGPLEVCAIGILVWLAKNCEIGVGFSFAALSVFRLRRAEAASAVWIPHWHWEPFESQGTRAAKRYVNGNLAERGKGDEFGIKLLLPHRLSPVGTTK